MDPVNRPPEYSQLGPRHLPPRRAPGQTQERRQRRWCSATTPSRRSRIWRATGRRSPAPKIIRDREVVRSLDYPRSRDTRDRDEMRREYPNTHTHTHTAHSRGTETRGRALSSAPTAIRLCQIRGARSSEPAARRAAGHGLASVVAVGRGGYARWQLSSLNSCWRQVAFGILSSFSRRISFGRVPALGIARIDW